MEGADILSGKTSYDGNCAGCHGPQGEGGSSVPFDFSNGLGSGGTPVAQLAEYIDTTMPLGTPTLCEGECAVNVAAYIHSWDAGFALASVESCMEGAAPGANTTTVFEDQGEVAGGLTGWSHVAANAGGEFDGLAMETDSALYAIPGPVAADSTCGSAETMRAVLVKKYGNWDHQHANGLEPSLTMQNKTFSDVDSIVLEFKINSDNTVLPSAEYLTAQYDQLTATEIGQLDSGKVNLAISIIGPRTEMDHAEGDIVGQAERYIEIDPVNFDQWLRVTIPFESMNFYSMDDYVKTLSDLSALASTPVDVLQINPEIYGNRRSPSDLGTFGNVVRNFDSTDYSPEVFKEIDITIKKVEVNWK